MSRKKRQKKPRGKATARNQRREKWELPILYDRRAAMVKVLAEDEPGGTIWVNDHEAGAPVVWHNRVTLKTGGTIAYPWPLPSELLLRAAELRLERATHLRVRLLETASDGGELYPEHKTVNNYDLVFEFFQEAMTGVVLVYAALNNFSNEHIPQDFSMEWKERNEGRDYFIDRGIELRLSKVLHAATGKPNLKSDRPELWDQICHLKALRDDIQHANGGIEAFSTTIDMDKTIFARLINEERLQSFTSQVRGIIDMYRDDEYGPQNMVIDQHTVKLVSARKFAKEQQPVQAPG